MTDDVTGAAELPSPEEALATIAAAELILAKHREQPFAELQEHIARADLPGLAVKFRALAARVTGDADRMLMAQRADVLADTPRFASEMAKANAARIAAAAKVAPAAG